MAAVVEKGSNVLRGGKNRYSAKTLNGNFVEDRLEPAFEGVRRSAATTTAAMELEATKTRVDTIGAGLKEGGAKFDDTIDYGNVVGYDKTAGSKAWKSVNRSAFSKGALEGKKTEFSTSFNLASTGAPGEAALKEYRARWSNEGPKAAERRFTSQNARATNASVPKKYAVAVTRKMAGVPKSVEEFRNRIVERGGCDGIRGIGRLMRIMDDSGDGQLSRVEFKNGLMDFGLDFTEGDFYALWNYFDRDKSGTISYDEFLRGIRGPMNDRRYGFVVMAFNRLDKTGDGKVTIDDLRGVYDATFHPDVVAGRITPDEAITKFMSVWESSPGAKKDGVVTLEEFEDYYTDVSASIDDDDEWELMMRNAWHIAGGEGWCANTSNMRVLATLADGSSSVVVVENDMGLKRDDEAGIIARLKEQGVDAIDVTLNL